MIDFSFIDHVAWFFETLRSQLVAQPSLRFVTLRSFIYAVSRDGPVVQVLMDLELRRLR